MQTYNDFFLVLIKKNYLSPEFSERARYLEKRAENLELQRKENETPPSDQEVPEDLIIG